MSDHKLKKEDLDKINYINLKNKTSYSLMTAIGVVKDHLETCQNKGHAGLCITDNGVMMASLDQYNQCKSANFPAVLGNSLSIVPDTRMKHLLIKANNVGIYVKNFNGYQNASFLTSIGSENEKFYKTPRIDFHDLFENKEGLILTCGGFTGVISQAILQKKGLIKKVILKNINNENLIDFLKSNKEISLDQITEIMNLLIHEKDDEKDIRIFLNDKINYQSFKFILLTEETHKVLEESFPIQKDKIDLIPTPSADIEEDKDGKIDVKKRDEAKRVSESVFYNAINIIQEFSADDLIESFKKEFKDDFYLELSFLPKDKYWDREEKTHLELDDDPNEQIIKKYIELSENYKVKIVATQESYMKNQEDHLLQSIMLWNRPGSKDGFYFPLAQYIMTLEEMYDLMQENYSFLTDDQFLEWTSNTNEFIEKSKDLVLKFRPSLPNLPYEDHYVNKVPVVIQRKLMNRLQEEELWNEEIKARIKKNKSIQDEELVPDSLKEEFPTEESCINFEEMKEREKENIFLEETLNKMEDFYKDTDPAFVKLLKKSQKDLPLRTSLKVMMRNKKIAPRKVDEEKMQALIDKNPKTKGKKFSEFPIEQMERIAEKKGFFVSDTDPMLLLGNEIVRDRLTYELNTIQYNGILKLITYFMLLEDVSNFINENPSAEKGLGRGCLTGDTLVLTKEKGYINLKDVSQGDYVYTLENKWKKVIKTFSYKVNENISEVFTKNMINPIKMTTDHKVFAQKKEDTKISYFAISELQEGDYILSPKLSFKDEYGLKNRDLYILNKNQKNYINDERDIHSDKYYYNQIEQIYTEKEDIFVYDLMIEDNPSYLTSNFLVHNSGAGSIVAHALDITDCDPLQYDLLFERFLTKERIGEVFTDLEKFSLEEFKEMLNTKETKFFIEAFGLNNANFKVEDLLKELEKDEEDLSKELQNLFIKERDTEDLKQWKEDELFFMECNPENLVYYIFMKNNLPKKDKLKNINNSTLAYLIGLTDDKPTDAMNATPTTLPDIDYDTNARDEIKEYLVYKFGREQVTLMGTFGTLKTKGAIKDVLRQLRPDMSFKDVNILTKNFEKIKETDYKSDLDYLHAGITEVKELKDYFDQNPEVLECVENILGNVKSTGIHAGGVVVAGEDVTRVVPCHFERKKENMWVTQPDMKYVEWAGLIKYDLLGLNTLNDLNRAFRLIEKRTGKQIDGKKIPLNDPAVMRRFRKGDTMSIFQFGSELFKQLVTKLNEINNINDLAIITSINRPGPLDMGMDKSFIKRVNKEEPITYFHPSLEPILKDTYGITCYQEQVMSIVREVGGLTGNESVVVLKAMGKKQLDKLMKFKKKFLDEAVKKYPEMGDVVDFEDPESKEMIKVPLAEKIWLYLEAFAKYGFNKSHAIAYSTVSYYCMWLKHYYEIEWITAVLSGSSKDDFKEFYSQWYDKVLKPDINKSKKDYIIEAVGDTDKCIMPFSFINGVGDKAVQSIVSCQPFASFEDFFQRVDKRRVNKTSIINLIMSGTFDSLKDSICQDKITKMEEQTSSIKEKITEGKVSPEERVDLIEEGKGLKAQIDKLKELPIADYRKMLIKDFFDLKAKQKKPSKKERLEIEAFMEELEEMNRGHFLMKEVSLLNLTAFNYYEFYKDHMTRGALAKFGKEAITPEQALKAKDRTKVVVGGAIESIKIFPIKNGKNRGKNMAKLTLINKDSKIGITVFSNKLETDSSGRNMIRDLEEFTPVIIEGTIQRDPKWGTSILFNKGWDLSK